MTAHRAHAFSTASTVRRLTFLLAALAVATAACGGADSTPAKAPAQERHDKALEDEALSEPRTIEEAQDRIAQASAALEAKGDAKASSESAPQAEPPTAPQGGATAPGAPRREREDTCGSPCRALASMKRAVEALCRMTGDTDDRCVDAKRTLGESTSRVASCRCEGR